LVTSPQLAARYAELTADPNPIHLDADFAAKTSFGAPIAHGTMALNLLIDCLEQAFGRHLHGFSLDVRFIRPVFVGETIRAGARLLDATAGCYEVYVETADGKRTIEGTLSISDGCEGDSDQ
jgi:acyl dehydratase